MNFSQALESLEKVVLPFLRHAEEELSKKFPTLPCRVYAGDGGDLSQDQSYSLLLECKPNAEISLLLIVSLKQYNLVTNPTIGALVMTVNEAYDDFTMPHLQLFPTRAEANEETIKELTARLPELRQELETLILKR